MEDEGCARKIQEAPLNTARHDPLPTWQTKSLCTVEVLSTVDGKGGRKVVTAGLCVTAIGVVNAGFCVTTIGVVTFVGCRMPMGFSVDPDGMISLTSSEVDSLEVPVGFLAGSHRPAKRGLQAVFVGH